MQGMTKNTPGPRAFPVSILPSLNTTALSYSCTTWAGDNEIADYLVRVSPDDLDDPAEGDGEGDGDQEEGEHGEDEGGEARGLLTVLTLPVSSIEIRVSNITILCGAVVSRTLRLRRV